MKILVLGDSYCPASALRSAFEELIDHDVTFADVVDEPDWQPASESEGKLREYLGSPSQVIGALDRHEVLVVQGAPVSDEVIASAPELRLICVARGGPVNVDVDAATERGIAVVTTPGKNATAVAELTLGLMIMIGRRLPEAWGHVSAGGDVYLDNYEGGSWYGHELADHTLGLVGFGQIGRRVAARALAFGMHVLAYDPHVADAEMGAAGVEPKRDLDELLAASDYVSLHARATPESRGLFDAARFARMRPGAYFINTARDELVDEDALDEALRSGHLAGAALDVAGPSEAGSRHRLLASPNVVLLPHVGGATLETLTNGGRMAVAEIECFAAGRPLVNVANPAALDVLGAAR